MKRPSYRNAIETVALNDEPTCLDIAEVSGQMTVVLVGWLFEVPAEKVAFDIVAYRMKYNK
jgi:hypothetical protein